MSYAVTVDTSQPQDAPDLDALQRAWVVQPLGEACSASSPTYASVYPQGSWSPR